MIVHIIIILLIATLIVSLAEKHPCDGWLIHNEKCYKYTIKEMSYKTAIDYCKQVEATILKITTPEENQFLTQLLSEDFHIWTDVWLGMTLTNGSKTLLLDDGTKPLYTNWAPRQPDMNLNQETCSEMMFGKWHNDWINISSHMGEWNDAICSDTNAVICEKPLPKQFNGCEKA